MTRISLLLLVLILFNGCIPERITITPDKRVEVSGKVFRSQSGDPVPQIAVASFGTVGNLVDPRDSNRLGFSRTSATGNFNFISLDTQNRKFSVGVNPAGEDFYQEDYATYYYIDTGDHTGTIINLGTISLPRLLTVEIIIKNTSGTSEELRYTITYKDSEQYYLLGNSIPSEEEEYYDLRNFRTFGGIHNYDEEDQVWHIATTEDSEVKLNYTLGDGDPQEVIISVTPEISEYVFEY